MKPNDRVQGQEAKKTIWTRRALTSLHAIISRLRSAQNEISMHSIWPDMLGQMVSQTHEAMTAIQNELNHGFQSPGGIVPTIQSAAPTIENETPTSSFARAERQAITVPVNVYLDRQQMQSFLESPWSKQSAETQEEAGEPR
jgi:hypothetical protein